MFSNQQVSDFINATFEPAWESVRPVPRVSIDFGNGKVVRRTLHGNVVTWVCNSDGQVLDALPGVYEPVMYSRRLQDLAKLFEYARQHEMVRGDSLGAVQEYHDRQAERLERGQPRDQFVREVRRTITGVERGVRLMLQPAARIQSRARRGVRNERFAGFVPDPNTRSTSERPAQEELAEWKSLGTDTKLNETKRRLQIHQYLRKQPLQSPQKLRKWMYREVLHADLDDPWLGLGKLLFGNYPFDDGATQP